MSNDPISDAIRQRAYEQAVAELPSYVQRRWAAMPTSLTPALALAWVQFQATTPAKQMAMFAAMYMRSAVLAIDRANQIADADASVAVMAVEQPAA